MKLTFSFPKIKKGGAGSGHFGHSGRPGHQGGSVSGGGGGSSSSSVTIPDDVRRVFENNLKNSTSRLISSSAASKIISSIGRVTTATQRNMGGPAAKMVKLNKSGKAVLEYALANSLLSSSDSRSAMNYSDDNSYPYSFMNTVVSRVWGDIHAARGAE